MRSFAIVSCACAALLLVAGCSRHDYRQALVGTWEWTGDACGRDGSCKKEIITDEENREVFTSDGVYLSKRAKTGYTVEGVEIRLASDSNTPGTLYGEIVSLREGVMLLKQGKIIRRYNRADRAK